MQFDYKSDVGHETVRGTGFSKLKPLGVPDYAQITCILQKRWEDEDGEVHALRVATGIKLITESVSEWQNGYRIEFRYGDITSEADFQPYMGLKNCDDGPVICSAAIINKIIKLKLNAVQIYIGCIILTDTF